MSAICKVCQGTVGKDPGSGGCGCSGGPTLTFKEAVRRQVDGPVPEVKATNPKDAIGSGKLPIGLVPDSAIALESLAFLEGATKYGRYNWRAAGVRASIYHDALRRHLAAWWNGEDADPATGIPHLASVRACAAILIDAAVIDKLTDDRPPRAELVGELQRALADEVPRIRELYPDANPHQYTIADSEGTDEQG